MEVSKALKSLESPEHIELVGVLYNKLKQLLESTLNNETVNARNIIVIIDSAMKLVGKMSTLDGLQKKALVMTVVKKLVEESNLSPEDEEIVKIIVERALDPVIDQIFAMAPEVYGKVKTKCMHFCKCFPNKSE